VKSGLGLDKAGGYGIQDGFGLVKEIQGSYSNIVGFPTEIYEVLLKDFGFKK
jgi:predicted house-cleaning NTP pyrophosphatase (Maf/HAM1 superfamily)